MRFPIPIELRRSFLLVVLLVLVHAGAAVCVILLPWDGRWQAVLLAGVALSLVRALKRPDFSGLRLCSKDSIEALYADGRRAALKPLPETTVFRWLVVLRWRVDGEPGTFSLCVLPDQLRSQDFRLLRVWLRCFSERPKRVS